MDVVGNGVGVVLGHRAFVGADDAGEVAEVVHHQRHVGGQGLADRLAVVDGVAAGEKLEVLLGDVGDLVEDLGALGDGHRAPLVFGGMGGV